MPTYEYECRSCGHRFERFQAMTARPNACCPRCARPARRLISAGAGLLFKGSGFYATDYRSSGYQKQAKAESKSGTDAKGSGCGSGKACAAPD